MGQLYFYQLQLLYNYMIQFNQLQLHVQAITARPIQLHKCRPMDGLERNSFRQNIVSHA